MKIGIAADHRGYKLKEYIKENLEEVEIVDFGTDSEESCDYPDLAFALSEAVANEEVTYGVAICGSGIGISIACNKVKGIRCAKVDTVEDASMTRNDNDANIIALKADIEEEKAIELIKTFICTPFSNIERHVNRINKIKEYEER